MGFYDIYSDISCGWQTRGERIDLQSIDRNRICLTIQSNDGLLTRKPHKMTILTSINE